MEEKKRKSKTSTAVKKRYNDKVYTHMAFVAPKEMAAEFKEKCKRENVSQASIFKEAMERFLKDE